MDVERYAALFSEEVQREILSRRGTLTEIRLRPERPAELVSLNESCLAGGPMAPREIQKIALRLMNHSYYACEQELSEGFFTLPSGDRVGVCGTYIMNGGTCQLQSIGSLCIRVARTVPGCARELVEKMLEGGLSNTVILSRPGLGKTTMLRDAARLLSERGLRVAIADERHEIAACCGGVPTLPVGERTDVIDGSPKGYAMERLIRTMAPQVIIADEIGNTADVKAVREIVRRGAVLLTSAHAGGFDALEKGMLGGLIRDGVFSMAVLLEGRPGRIAEIRHYGKGE